MQYLSFYDSYLQDKINSSLQNNIPIFISCQFSRQGGNLQNYFIFTKEDYIHVCKIFKKSDVVRVVFNKIYYILPLDYSLIVQFLSKKGFFDKNVDILYSGINYHKNFPEVYMNYFDMPGDILDVHRELNINCDRMCIIEDAKINIDYKYVIPSQNGELILGAY